MVTVVAQKNNSRQNKRKGVKSGINMCSDEITCCKYANQNAKVCVYRNKEMQMFYNSIWSYFTRI